MLTELLCGSDCDVTVVGSAACKAMFDHSSSDSALHIIDNASVFWEFLKGRKLPGVMALDKASTANLLSQLFNKLFTSKNLDGTYT